MQLLWVCVRISLGDAHHMMVKNIGSNPIAPTNAKNRNKKILYNGKGYYYRENELIYQR